MCLGYFIKKQTFSVPDAPAFGNPMALENSASMGRSVHRYASLEL
jgi:hypothetical protein